MNNELEQILIEAGIQIHTTISERLTRLLELDGKILMLQGQIDLCDRLMKFKEDRGEEITDKMEQNQLRLKDTLRCFKNSFRILTHALNKQAQTE